MMILAVVLNAAALIFGFFNQMNLLYVLCGISWVAFFGKYAKATWFIYERAMKSEVLNTVIDVWMMHQVTTVIVMIAIYFMIEWFAGGLCGILAIAQCTVFQGISVCRDSSGKNVLILVCLLVELFLMVVCVC
ncbi:MAG: hypothetical protein NC081_09190 [Roseburia sp.]|nr:hypothetical protein [Roseburia sp.]